MILPENNLSSFGAILKTFRKRRHFTQQQLARSVGVHRHAVGRWERGDVLPANKAMVLELVRHLHLDEQETRQLLEASLTALAPYWHVPFPRNPYFTGREELLEKLHAQLGADQGITLLQSSALQGLGGIGKTQLALEYAYRHALEYSAVFWLRAETNETVISSLLYIAELLQLPERQETDQQRVMAAVQRWLSTHSQWLVICDNVEELDLLPRFLPPARSGAILITTRHQVLGTLARGLDLLPMKPQEGILFLLRRAKVLPPEATSEEVQQFAMQMPAQHAAAAELVSAMGGLPLALDQAGAYLEETQCGVPAYLDLFHRRGATLLQQRGKGVRDHPSSVATTFALATAATTRQHPAVWDLLQICALLQPDTIPEELFRQGAAQLGPALEAVCCDELEWNRLIAVACSYSLLQRQSEEQTLSLHRLVQAIILDAMTEAEQEQWSKRVIAALEAVFPEVPRNSEYTGWKQGERLISHVCAHLEQVGDADGSLTFASLACKAARYLHERGRYAEAEPFLLRAQHVRERMLGPDHLQVATVLYHLAVAYREQGKYTEAEPLLLRVLHIQERLLGPDHPDVADALNQLAALSWSKGKHIEAQQLLQRALHIWEQHLGPEHPRVAIPLNNLAGLYHEQGKYIEAQQLLQRALRIREQHLGPEHPSVAGVLFLLANIHEAQGRYKEAELLYLRALHIWEQHLGPEHPQTAYSFSGLANIHATQERYKEAESLYLRALHIWEQHLGSEHPNVAEPLTGLANLFREQGKYEKAEALYLRALRILEQSLGPGHPQMAETLHELVALQEMQKNYQEALSLCQRALAFREHILGPEHPKTIASRTLYAQLEEKNARVQDEEPFPHCRQEHSDHVRITHLQEEPALTPQEMSVGSLAESDPLQEFLNACCELHPRAWCRSAELWQAYEDWVKERQEPYPLSRRALMAQLKERGCHADRTMTARIWRGIAVVKKEA